MFLGACGPSLGLQAFVLSISNQDITFSTMPIVTKMSIKYEQNKTMSKNVLTEGMFF